MNTSAGVRSKLGAFAFTALLLALSVPGMAARSAIATNNQANKIAAEPLIKEVRHQLLMLPFYSVFDDLRYEVKPDGTVVLSGEVVRPVLKGDAAAAVKHIRGVEKVENNIKVLPLSPFDNTIRRAEFRRIYGQLGFERYAIQAVPPIHIIVENGNVTLVGVVANESDRRLAGIVANQVPNVFHVTNNLTVEP